MAELLGLKGSIKIGVFTGKDANELHETSVGLNMNSMKNVPFNYGTIVNINTANTHIVQLYFAADLDNRVYYRNHVGGNWTAWFNL